MLTGDNGLLTKAGEAKEKTQKAGAKEKIQTEVLGCLGLNGKIDADELIANLKSHYGLTDSDIKKGADNGFPLTVTMDGYTFEIQEKQVIKYQQTKVIQ